jgi:hypothetical protein
MAFCLLALIEAAMAVGHTTAILKWNGLCPLGVKSRLVINALLEQLGIFLMPDFQRLNG